MIHVSLINYKALYEESLTRYDKLASELLQAHKQIDVLKFDHNNQWDIIEGLKEELVKKDVEHDNSIIRLKGLVGGDGSIEERINNVLSKTREIGEENEHLRSKLEIAERKIQYLASENLSVKVEHTENDYKRLEEDYNRLKESYENLERCYNALTE